MSVNSEQNFYISEEDIPKTPEEWSKAEEEEHRVRGMALDHRDEFYALKQNIPNAMTKWVYVIRVLLACFIYIVYLCRCITSFNTFKNSIIYQKFVQISDRQMQGVSKFIINKYSNISMDSYAAYGIGMCVICNIFKLCKIKWDNGKQFITNNDLIKKSMSKYVSFASYILSKNKNVGLKSLADILLFIIACFMEEFENLYLFQIIFESCPMQILAIVYCEDIDKMKQFANKVGKDDNNVLQKHIECIQDPNYVCSFSSLFVITALNALGLDYIDSYKNDKIINHDICNEIMKYLSNKEGYNCDNLNKGEKIQQGKLKYLLKKVNDNDNNNNNNDDDLIDYFTKTDCNELVNEILYNHPTQVLWWTNLGDNKNLSMHQKQVLNKIEMKYNLVTFGDSLWNQEMEFGEYLQIVIENIHNDMLNCEKFKEHVNKTNLLKQRLLKQLNLNFISNGLLVMHLKDIYKSAVVSWCGKHEFICGIAASLFLNIMIDSHAKTRSKSIRYEKEAFYILDSLFCDNIVKFLSGLSANDKSFRATQVLAKYNKRKAQLKRNEKCESLSWNNCDFKCGKEENNNNNNYSNENEFERDIAYERFDQEEQMPPLERSDSWNQEVHRRDNSLDLGTIYYDNDEL